jgi:hypothetical protein
MKIVGKSKIHGKLVASLDGSYYKISNIDHWGRCYVAQNTITLEDKLKRSYSSHKTFSKHSI